MKVWLIIGFIIGLIIIVKGGDFFLDAATWIAEVSGVPKFIIGATIVSIATTLPEIFVSSLAAYQARITNDAGKIDIAIGNAIGSVTANTGLILSIGILFMSITVVRKQFMNKGFLLLITLATLFVLSLPGELTGAKSIYLLLLFCLYICDNIRCAKKEKEVEQTKPEVNKTTIMINILKFIFGTAGIVIGSQLLVNNGSDIAKQIGISEKIIGLTAIAIGTSLPELVTTITAIIKKESSISVGNIIGANVIDTALILPVCTLISGGSVPVSESVLFVDMPVCFFIACIAVIPAVIQQRFYKWQGILMLLLYSGYLVFTCVGM